MHEVGWLEAGIEHRLGNCESSSFWNNSML